MVMTTILARYGTVHRADRDPPSCHTITADDGFASIDPAR